MISASNFIIFWIVSGFLCYGFCLAHFRRVDSDTYRNDLVFSMLMGLMGPLGLIVAIINGAVSSGFRLK